MALHLFFAALSVPVLGMALINSRRRHLFAYVIWKVGASLLFLASAAVAPYDTAFDHLLLIGLVGHALGDLLIAWPTGGARFLFPVAIGSFLTGHAFYFLAFQSGRALWDLHPGMLILSGAVNFFVFYQVRGLLGRLRIPGFFYTLGLTLMCAAGLTTGLTLGTFPALLLAAGAVVYNLSDGAVVRERFVHASFANKLWGLPAYYLAQHLLVNAMAFF